MQIFSARIGEANPVSQASSYATAFASTENPLSEGGIWVQGGVDGGSWNNVKTDGANCIGASDTFYLTSRYADDVAHLKKSFFDFVDNQYAQGTVYKADGYTGNGGSHEVELLLRWEITNGNIRGYEVLFGVPGLGYLAIVRWNGPLGDYTALYADATSIAAIQDGDVLRAEMIGNQITVYKNTVQVAQVSDSAFTEGQPGVGFWPVDGAIKESLGWKDFSCGNL